jgi:hypothetical protein
MPGDRLSYERLDAALGWCSSEAAVAQVARSRHLAVRQTDALRNEVRASAGRLAADSR